MSKLRTMLLAAAAIGALTATASAMPLGGVTEPDSNLAQNARLICDQWGRCYEARRHFYRDYDEGYYPRRRAYGYYGAEPYGYYDEGPSVGFSFGFR